MTEAGTSYPNLERRCGPLARLGGGAHSRVYAAGDHVIKVYRNFLGWHELEAANMRRAGLGEWVVDATETDGAQVLILKRFPGRPVTAQDLPRVLPQLRSFLRRLHDQRHGEVDLAAVSERLRRFRTALAAYPLDDLFTAVEGPLRRGELRARAAYCHLDLWSDNILVADDDGMLIIDWTRAAYDDPIRDIALLKTGTLDLLPPSQSVQAALDLLPNEPNARGRLRAYLAHTYLHDLYWFLMREPYEFDAQMAAKLPRARHALEVLPAPD